MGRKIPARKHRGIKDPIKQNEQRFEKVRMKINEPPQDVDHQAVPRKLKLILKSTEASESKGVQKKKGNKSRGINSCSLSGAQRPLKPIPSFKRFPGESDRAYQWRTETISRNFLSKAKFEKKYGVDVILEPQSGETKIEKPDLSYLDDGSSVASKPATKWEKKKLKKLQQIENERKLRKEQKMQKLKEKKSQKKHKKENDGEDIILNKHDKVEFGEVVQEPPQLTAKPRNSDNFHGGKVNNLILSHLISSKSNQDFTGKRKDLEKTDRRRLEFERERAVTLYRQIQKEKQERIQN